MSAALCGVSHSNEACRAKFFVEARLDLGDVGRVTESRTNPLNQGVLIQITIHRSKKYAELPQPKVRNRRQEVECVKFLPVGITTMPTVEIAQPGFDIGHLAMAFPETLGKGLHPANELIVSCACAHDEGFFRT
jgi:hypothetical protein